jgi:hypothetical protein
MDVRLGLQANIERSTSNVDAARVARERKLRTEDLRNWRMLDRFVKVLRPVVAKRRLDRTFSDRRRTLGYAPYLSLFLFGLFNPVV